MFRRLTPIEIAEGALLADLAVIFQLISIYVPFADNVFSFLVMVVFTILVLRRGLYPGMMGLCVAICVVGMVTGKGSLIIMLLEGTAGLFLGFTMKHRLPHLLLIFVGVTGAAVLVFGGLIGSSWLLGVTFSDTILGLQRVFAAFISIVGFITTHIGLAFWWQHTLHPVLLWLAAQLAPYWYIFFFAGIWLILWPVVIICYLFANVTARLLGYPVRPFPDGWRDRLLRWFLRRLIRMGIRRGIIGRAKARTKASEPTSPDIEAETAPVLTHVQSGGREHD